MTDKNHEKAVKDLHKLVSDFTKTSLGTISVLNEEICCCTYGNDIIQEKIFSSEKLKNGLLTIAESSSSPVIKFIGGSTFFCVPISSGDNVLGYLFSGPIWKTITDAQLDKLVSETQLNRNTILEYLQSRSSEKKLNNEQHLRHIKSLADILSNTISTYKIQKRSSLLAETFYKLSTKLEKATDIDVILPTILKSTSFLLNATIANITLLDNIHGHLHMYFKDGDKFDSISEIPLNEDIDSWIMRESIEEIYDNGDTCTVRVPITDGSSKIGFIKVIDADTHSENDPLQILKVIAEHGSAAIAKAVAYNQSVYRTKELEALQEISESLSKTSVDISKTLDKVLDHACKLLNAKAASIMLWDKQDPRYLVINRAKGLSEEVIRTTKVKIGERISGKVAMLGKPIYLPGGYNSEGQKKEASLCVPLKKDDTVIGVLNISDSNSSSGDFTSADKSLVLRLAHMSALVLESARMHSERIEMLQECLKALANAIDARDAYTRGHSERVAGFSLLIGKRIPNFNDEDMWDLRNAALLHDIGKIRIPDRILRKPGFLDDDEREEINRHPAYGAAIIKPIKSFQKFMPSILHHHERFDGGRNGYPDHKAGMEIPQGARIIAVADTFDAMTSDRPYRKGMPVKVAIERLKAASGTQLDPEMVDYFLEAYEAGEIEPIMELDSTRYGAHAVILDNNYQVLKPEEAAEIYLDVFGPGIDMRQIYRFLNIYEKGELPVGTSYNGRLSSRIRTHRVGEGSFYIWKKRGKKKNPET